MSGKSSGLAFFKGLMYGATIGSVLGLLYAPKRGRETREELKEKSAALKGDAEAKLETTQKRVESLLDDVQKQLALYRREATAKVAESKQKAVADVKEVVALPKRRLKEAFDAGVQAFKEERSAQTPKTSSS